MDFQFTNEQAMWRDVVFGFMNREFPRDKLRRHDQAREFPEELYRKMASEGWLGLLIPEEHGGLDARVPRAQVERGNRQPQESV